MTPEMALISSQMGSTIAAAAAIARTHTMFTRDDFLDICGKAFDAAGKMAPAVKAAKKQRLCILCHKNPPAVPDREQMGRQIKRVCLECHRDRLRGDALRILRMYDNK